MKAAQLALEARRVLTEDTPQTRGLWSRVATHLARQALEAALDEYWDQRAPGLSSAPTRAQLICLRAYRSDVETCRRLAWAWSALSDATHARGAQPTRTDLEAWIGAIDQFLSESPSRR